MNNIPHSFNARDFLYIYYTTANAANASKTTRCLQLRGLFIYDRQ